MGTSEPLGLRERKKLETRLAISNVATGMFMDRGFDAVTIAEVAEAANVSVNTIFNYFNTKEDLFFDRSEELEDELCRVIRERRVGESAIDALERFFHEAITGGGHLLFRRGTQILAFMRTIDASPALKARQLVIAAESQRRVTETLAKETGAKPDDPTARIAAAMMLGALWLIIQDYRARLMRGDSEKATRAAVKRLGAKTFAMLRDGLGSYATSTRRA